MAVHTFNPRTREADPCELKANLVYRVSVPGQPGLHGDIISKNQKAKQTKRHPQKIIYKIITQN